MKTIGIDELLEAHDQREEVEVLVGLSEGATVTDITNYCGGDGEVVREPGFGICRVRVTVSCLRDLREGGDAWVDFIEPAARETEKPWDTQYDEEYTSQ